MLFFLRLEPAGADRQHPGAEQRRAHRRGRLEQGRGGRAGPSGACGHSHQGTASACPACGCAHTCLPPHRLGCGLWPLGFWVWGGAGPIFLLRAVTPYLFLLARLRKDVDCGLWKGRVWTYLWSLVETDHVSAFLFQVLNHKLYKSRVEFDTAIDQVLAEFSADIVCLAGFMRILSGPFVRKWNGEWQRPGATLRGLVQVHLAVSWPGDPTGVFTGH